MAKTYKVAINYGHGGNDPGAVSNGLREKDLTKAIGQRVTKILRDNYKVVVKEIRQSQSGGGLTQITNEANAWGADIFVSIHINSGGGTGFESFIYNGAVSAETRRLQQAVHEGVVKEINVTNRGMKRANFAVVRQTRMPAVLTENMFIDTKADADKLKDSKFLDKVALGHANGIATFLGLKKGSGSVAPSKPAKPSKPTPSKPKPKPSSGKLAVDGYWGVATNKALQKALGTTQDGVLSGQYRNSTTNKLSKGAVRYGTIGSLVIKELQKLVGVKRDGYLGPDTVRELQKYLGTTQDGKLSSPSLVVKEMQRQLNAGTFGKKGAVKPSTSSPKSKNKLDVEGSWGKATTRELQRALGTTVDGIISGQSRNKVSQSLYGGTVSFTGSQGSAVIRALQRKVEADVDGLLGAGTVRALQKYLGTTQDGVLSKPSLVVKELQRRLNNGTF